MESHYIIHYITNDDWSLACLDVLLCVFKKKKKLFEELF